jgi:hypothetical protein
MTNKTSSTNTLSSYWCPPNEAGEPETCVASTFEFDASFFEDELLPRFLGRKFDRAENAPTFCIEREEKLRQTNTAVLVDIHKVDPKQTTLSWDQNRVAVPGVQAIQHAKIVLLVWEKWIRLIVGSANLTPAGYRRNREVFAALDFWNDPDSVPRSPLDGAIMLLERMLTWSRVPERTQQKTLKPLSGVRAKLGGWPLLPSDFRLRQRPHVRFVQTRQLPDRILLIRKNTGASCLPSCC